MTLSIPFPDPKEATAMEAWIAFGVIALLVFCVGYRFGWASQQMKLDRIKVDSNLVANQYKELHEEASKLLANYDHVSERLKECSGENARLKRDNQALTIQLGRTQGSKARL